MITLDAFVELVQDELGLPVTPQTAAADWDELPGWDSVQLLTLLTLLERETGRSLSLPAFLDAASLEQVYRIAVES